MKLRGISHEQVCVATAIDRQGNLITELLCKGRMTFNDLKKRYVGRIGKSSILCTDSHKNQEFHRAKLCFPCLYKNFRF